MCSVTINHRGVMNSAVRTQGFEILGKCCANSTRAVDLSYACWARSAQGDLTRLGNILAILGLGTVWTLGKAGGSVC